MNERNEAAEPAGKIEAKKLRRAHHAAEARTAIGRGRRGIDRGVLNQERHAESRQRGDGTQHLQSNDRRDTIKNPIIWMVYSGIVPV
jgi:hypothetical protein